MSIIRRKKAKETLAAVAEGKEHDNKALWNLSIYDYMVDKELQHKIDELLYLGTPTKKDVDLLRIIYKTINALRKGTPIFDYELPIDAIDHKKEPGIDKEDIKPGLVRLRQMKLVELPGKCVKLTPKGFFFSSGSNL